MRPTTGRSTSRGAAASPARDMPAAIGEAMARPEDWHAYRPFPTVGGRNERQGTIEIPLLVRALALRARGRILELGCGRGIALPVLHRLLRPARLVGLDIDRLALADAADRASAHGIPVELVHADTRCLPFAHGSFDLVIDFGTCYHVSYPHLALREAARVLAPDGLFVEETRVSQLLSHPVRSFGRTLPWGRVRALRLVRSRVLWVCYAVATEPRR